jgi:7,8-dihydro-6-hydroxymethylpterin dimethyltransferase
MSAGAGPVSHASERLVHETTSLCRVCKNAVPAQVWATGAGEIWMRKRCAAHGPQEVRLSADAAWYEATRAIAPRPYRPRAVAREVSFGCPFDCGPCTAHTQDVRLPVVTITSACNLDCPICYVHNKNEGAFHMERDQFRRVLDHLVADHGGELDIVNLTGGEPTLHPHLLELLAMAREAGVHRVTVCSNGVRLARDEEFVAELARLGARIALSFDTFDKHADVALQGARLLETKLRCLDLLQKHDVDTTLIPVMTRGLNDHEIGDILRLALDRPNIRHLEVHLITYTGQGGVSFDRAGRMSMDEVLVRIDETTGGLLTRDDFVPSPCAHPLCYQIAYLLMDPAGGPPLSFARLTSRETLYDCLADRLYLEPTQRLEDALREAINRLWTAGDGDAESARALRVLDSLLRALFPIDRAPLSPAEAMRVSERAAKAVYLHAHMDEETFDVERVAQCCDSNCYADGSTVPVCSYNVLYREKEAAFMAAPRVWNERSGGQRVFQIRSQKGEQGGTEEPRSLKDGDPEPSKPSVPLFLPVNHPGGTKP